MTIGICAVAFLVFLFLKLAGIGIVATWSWAVITAPLWLGFITWIVFFWSIAMLAILTKVWRR